MVEEQNLDLHDYLVSFRKRKKTIFMIIFTLMCFFMLVTYLLPSVYESSSTILIEQQEIPRELVMSTVTSYAAERIQTIQAQVMSRSNLKKIINKFDLYKSERKHETSEAIILKMRDDTTLDVISADIVDPATGRASSATIAFSLSFRGENPNQVQKVVSELTSLYLNKNLESRASKAVETAEFFREESARINVIISKFEEKLAKFKEDNAKMLPELQSMNMQVLQRIESSITTTNTNILNLEDRKFYLEGRLEQIEPDSPLVQSASTRLKILESDYASAASRYSESHPDVIALKNEIDALRSSSTGSMDALRKELKALQTESKVLTNKYTQEHPDVVALNAKIATLENKLSVEKNKRLVEGDANAYLQDSPDNPAYITLKAQLEGVLSELNALKQQRKEYFQKQADLETIMLKAPQVEREYLVLVRDYEDALRRNQDIKAKQRSADIAEQLETESKGERFTLIDPPAFPEAPVSPNRPAILLLGLIFSIAAAVGFAIISDSMGGAVRGAKGVERLLGMAPLSIVPYQLNMDDIVNHNKMSKRLLLITMGVIILAAFIIHFLITPLDVLWFRLLRKLEFLVS